MWTTPDPACCTRLSLMTLMGRLALANIDAAQRMQYLVSRLALGASDSCLRTHVLPHGDVLYSADRAALEQRVGLMAEAGAEGCVTIVRGLIEECTQAHIRCMEELFGLRTDVGPMLQLPFSAGTRLPSMGFPSFSARG
ncbi:MAG: hypothetical protein JNK97_12645 [Zoogloea sp.]|nr:hypothetical protein [Zoogloea sp.]